MLKITEVYTGNFGPGWMLAQIGRYDPFCRPSRAINCWIENKDNLWIVMLG